MFEGKLKISKKIYVFSAVIALIAAGFDSFNLITSSTNKQKFTETDKILPENEDINEIEPLPEIYYEPEGSYLYQRAGLSYDGGGKLEWKYKVADEELSTPALADLNPNLVGGQGDKEIVVASARYKSKPTLRFRPNTILFIDHAC